jgi:hypothetical protein
MVDRHDDRDDKTIGIRGAEILGITRRDHSAHGLISSATNACRQSIRARRSEAYAFESSRSSGILTNAGSVNHSSRSAQATFTARRCDGSSRPCLPPRGDVEPFEKVQYLERGEALRPPAASGRPRHHGSWWRSARPTRRGRRQSLPAQRRSGGAESTADTPRQRPLIKSRPGARGGQCLDGCTRGPDRSGRRGRPAGAA